MRLMQQVIFLQNYGYLGQLFEDMSIMQLVLEPVFVKVVKSDTVGSKHIKMNENNVEVVDVRFVSNERGRSKKHLLELVQRMDYSMKEVKVNLFGLLIELEEQMKELFGI